MTLCQNPDTAPSNPAQWLALVIGNSRLHWALFSGPQLIQTWHTPHLQPEQAQGGLAQLLHQPAPQTPLLSTLGSEHGSAWVPEAVMMYLAHQGSPLSLWVASVVHTQLSFWQAYPGFQEIKRDQIPLGNLYPSLGIDRALSLLGAGWTYGWPMLVIDGGTALTFTAGNDSTFMGGAILPGLLLQIRSLAGGTDALPAIQLPPGLPTRWANSTEAAIQSGILYTQLAGLRDYITSWRQQFSAGHIVITGGDGERLLRLLELTSPNIAALIHWDPDLMFRGIAVYRETIAH